MNCTDAFGKQAIAGTEKFGLGNGLTETFNCFKELTQPLEVETFNATE